MKYIILILFTLFSFSVQAQRVEQPTGSPISISRYRGALVVDSMLTIPKRDTTAFFIYKGDLIRNITDDKLYYLDENSAYKPMGGSGGGFINYADTATKIATKSDVNGVNLNSITFSGNQTKTVFINSVSGRQISGSFTDNDNQTLSINDRNLSISGGNSVTLPDYGELFQSITGVSGNTFTLSQLPLSSKWLIILMNNAPVSKLDYTISGNTVTINYNVSPNDYFEFYYKVKQ